MSAETTLHAALSNLSPVTNLVSDRIRPVALNQGDSYPAIAYKREATEYVNTIGNAAIAEKVTIDVICLAETFDEADALGNAVEAVSFEKVDRRAEYDPETKAFAAVVTVAVWP